MEEVWLIELREVRNTVSQLVVSPPPSLKVVVALLLSLHIISPMISPVYRLLLFLRPIEMVWEHGVRLDARKQMNPLLWKKVVVIFWDLP